MSSVKHIVTIGGGTGSAMVLSALIGLPAHLTALISVADSGGSTGRLRDEFGFLPVGDLRQALAALAVEDKDGWIQKILLYRFSKGSGLEGHNLGNLILTALQDMTGSTAKALEIASKVFRLNGHIYPITTQNVQLVIEYQDGTFIIGEHHLNPDAGGGKKIKTVHLSPTAKIYTKAASSIQAADLIFIGPGDLYASIAPNLIVKGMKSAMKKTQAKLVYLVNLMTTHSQTHHFTATDHVKVIEHFLARPLDYIIINSATPSPSILKAYAKQHEYPVIDDLSQTSTAIIRAPLLRHAPVSQPPSDTIPRSYLRHHPARLKTIIKRFLWT